MGHDLVVLEQEGDTQALGSTGLRGGNSTRETPVMEIQGRKSSTMREKLTGSDDTERVS